MSLWRQLSRGLRALTRRRASDRDLDDEVQHYLDEAIVAHQQRGLSPDAARRAAQLEVGNTTVVREEARSYGWENVVESTGADLRYAARRLRSSPGFTAVTVLTLSLGVGAATTIFSVVDPILLESLPYPRASQLVTLSDRADDGSPVAATFGTFSELQRRSRSFESLAASDSWRPSLTATTEPERLLGQRVSPAYFHTLGVSPAVGRDFAPEEGSVGGPRVAILSDRLLQRRFAGDRSIVGRSIRLDDAEYLVIGVMPPRFANVLSPNADIWAPLQEGAQAPFNSREWGHHYQIVGRLNPGVTLPGVTNELKSIAVLPIVQFARPPWANLVNGVLVRSLHDDVTGDVRPILLAIIGAVLLLLTIACVNVTNLLLARGAVRRGELAMRIALGAGRGRVLRQLLTETLLLAVIGGACGLLLAQLGTHALIALSPPGLPRVDAIGLNGAVLAFALVASTVIGLIVGVVPALTAARSELNAGLQGSSRRTAGGGAALRRGLVITEVALAAVLLVGAGLLMRSLEQLFAVAPGFNTSRLVTLQVIAPGVAYRSDTARLQYYERALETVRHVPGVVAAAFTSQLPLSDDLDGYGYELASLPRPRSDQDGSALRYAVTPGYLATMGIPVVRGRALEASDVVTGPEPILINESFARRRFGARNPIGERVRFGPETGGTRPWDVIVGVVGDVKQTSLAAGESDAFYVPMGRWWWVDNVQSLVVRTSGDPATLVPSIKHAIWSIDKNQPIERVITMDGLIARSASERRFALVIIESFALSALLLAAVGIYGVLSGSVSERHREIGVRAALGATRQNIVGLVVRQGLALTLLGVLLGAIGALGATRAIASLMFGVSRLDLATYSGVTTLIVSVSILACWLPAWRAARVDPAITLRAD